MDTRSICFSPKLPLEDRVGVVFNTLHVSAREKALVRAFLEPLRLKDNVTHEHYEHSLRVALLAERIGRFMHLESKALFYAGLLHDIGKCQTPLKTLGRKGRWTKADAGAIKAHVMDSYRMIKDRFDFTAEIVLLHHYFQILGYPAKLPPFLHKYSEGAKMMIKLCGYLLALADVYDAFHRDNGRADSPLTGEAIKAKMLEHFSDQHKLIEDLYDARIFMTS